MAKASSYEQHSHKHMHRSNKPGVATQTRVENTTVMSRHNPPTWGLKIPGRPPTPSEGAAQQYDRIGPSHSQKLWTFDNGTCLRYGPEDLVDEFIPEIHPFSNQIALIDTVIKDSIAVRARYETGQGEQDTDRAGAAGEEDPFRKFRQRYFDPAKQQYVTLESGRYAQVPSAWASLTKTVSVYSVPNKSDTPGESHSGLSNDTRFGMCGKPSYGAQEKRAAQHGQRVDNIHRMTMQQRIGSGLHIEHERGRGRGRGGRSRGQVGGRHDLQLQFPAETQSFRHSSRGVSRGNARGGKGRSRGRGGSRAESTHRHQRFQSQADLITDTPLTNFSVPVMSAEERFAIDQYEDLGPVASPEPSKHQNYKDYSQKINSLNGDHLDSLEIARRDMVENMTQDNVASRNLMEQFEMQSSIRNGADTRSFEESNGYYPLIGNSKTVGYDGHVVSNEQYFVPTFSHEYPASSTVVGSVRSFQGGEDQNSDNSHSHYLELMTAKTSARGDVFQTGDPPNNNLGGDSFDTPIHHYAMNTFALMNSGQIDSRRSSPKSQRGTPYSFGSIRGKRIRSRMNERESLTRPSSPFINGDGRSSEPLRNRPESLFPLISGSRLDESFGRIGNYGEATGFGNGGSQAFGVGHHHGE